VLRSRPVVLVKVALGLALAASLAIIFVPTGRGETISVDSTGSTEVVSSSRTLIEQGGIWVVALLTVPVVLCAVALTVAESESRRRWWVGLATTMTAGALVAAASIGLAYLPAAAALWAAVVVAR